MGYKTYTTNAIVCGSKDNYTSDRSFLLFTEEAGMLWATARSVRTEGSKQRCALQDFSLIRVSLVKGKGGWRIGSVEAIENPFLEAVSRPARTGVVNVVKFLRRFMHGEEAHPTIYHDATLALSCLIYADGEDSAELERQFTLRSLHTLGYIAPHRAYQRIIDDADPWSIPHQLPAEAHRAIEQALTVSHL